MFELVILSAILAAPPCENGVCPVDVTIHSQAVWTATHYPASNGVIRAGHERRRLQTGAEFRLHRCTPAERSSRGNPLQAGSTPALGVFQSTAEGESPAGFRPVRGAAAAVLTIQPVRRLVKAQLIKRVLKSRPVRCAGRAIIQRR